MMSPSPVAQHAPTSLSAYAEDPTMGPSPTLKSKNIMKQTQVEDSRAKMSVIDVCCIDIFFSKYQNA